KRKATRPATRAMELLECRVDMTQGPLSRSPTSRQVILATGLGDSSSRPQVANGLGRANSPLCTRRGATPELAKGAGDDRSVAQPYGERETGFAPQVPRIRGWRFGIG